MKNSVKVLAAALALGVSGGAFAAATSDGSISDTSSSDSATVTVQVEDAVKLTMASTDFDFGTYSDGDLTDQTRDYCVYRRGNDATTVTFKSANASGSFAMLGGGTNNHLLKYSVVTTTFSALVEEADNDFTADTEERTCATGAEGKDTMTVSIDSDDLDKVEAATYTDTLTVTVAPK